MLWLNIDLDPPFSGTIPLRYTAGFSGNMFE